jgi:hypothetical protein
MNAAELVTHFQQKWPDAFRTGYRGGFLGHDDNVESDRGGYPVGFHQWPLEVRNAWYAGFNRGLCDRTRIDNLAGCK